MWFDANISNVKSNYNLRVIFSYLEYPYILKLLKNNENLQNRLGLTLTNYKNKSDAKKYEYIKKTQVVLHYYKNPKINEKSLLLMNIIVYGFIFLIPFLIYSILLVSKKTFKDSNTRDNYNKKYYNIIRIINICLFIYDILIFVFTLLFSFYIYDDYEHDYGNKK